MFLFTALFGYKSLFTITLQVFAIGDNKSSKSTKSTWFLSLVNLGSYMLVLLGIRDPDLFQLGLPVVINRRAFIMGA